MKLIEIAIIATTILGILLAGSDSESWTWFLWSKVFAAGLLGASYMLCNVIRERE